MSVCVYVKKFIERVSQGLIHSLRQVSITQSSIPSFTHSFLHSFIIIRSFFYSRMEAFSSFIIHPSIHPFIHSFFLFMMLYFNLQGFTDGVVKLKLQVRMFMYDSNIIVDTLTCHVAHQFKLILS